MAGHSLPRKLQVKLDKIRKHLGSSSNAVLPIVGAGLSQGLPTWRSLLEELIDEVPSKETQKELKEALDNNQYLDAASLLHNLKSPGPNGIREKIKALYANPKPKRPETYNLVARLGVTQFATTNYDPWLVDAVTKQQGGRTPNIVVPGRDAPANLEPHAEPFVLMLHGEAKKPETCILTAEDYRELEQKPSFRKLMDALIGQRRLLFIGYSVSDKDLQWFLDSWQAVLPEGDERHWLLNSKIGMVDDHRFRRLGITPIEYSSEDKDDHSMLKPVLEYLGEPLPTPPSPIVSVYEGLETKRTEQEEAEGQELIRNERYDAALEKYLQLFEAKKALMTSGGYPATARLVERYRLEVGHLQFLLQDQEAADKTLQDLDEDLLDEPDRARLARLLAKVGSLDRAKTIVSQGTNPDTEEARILIAIIEGHVPDGDLPNLSLEVHAAEALMQAGRLPEAVRRAKLGLDNGPWTQKAQALGVLITCLARTLQEAPSDIEPLTKAQRHEVFGTIERTFPRLRQSDVVPRLRARIEWMAHKWATATRNPILLAETQENLETMRAALEGEDLEALFDAATLKSASELIARGDLDKALSSVSSSALPWEQSLTHAILRIKAGQTDGALEALLALRTLYPNREPILYALADAYLYSHRAKEALKVAHAAFEALPSFGNRLLYGKALALTDDGPRSWEVLEPLRSQLGEEPTEARQGILEILANVAEGPVPQAAADIYETLLSEVPTQNRPDFRLRRATMLSRLDNPSAAEEAWRFFEETQAGGSSPEDWGRAALLQLVGERPDARAINRMERIAKVLKDKFPNSPQAAQVRVMLNTRLGLPLDNIQTDFRQLLDVGLMRPASMNEVIDQVRKLQEEGRNFEDAYRKGVLSFDGFCRLAQVDGATIIQRLVDKDQPSTTPWLVTPLLLSRSTIDAEPHPELLCGYLELLILQALGLLVRLDEAERKSMRFCMFEETALQIDTEAANLQADAQPLRLQRLEALERLLATLVQDVSEGETGEEGGDARVTVFGVGQEAFSRPVHELVAYLVRCGEIPQSKADRVGGYASVPVSDVAIPNRFSLTYAAFETLSESGILSDVLQIARVRGWKVLRGPQARRLYEQNQAELRSKARATEYAIAVRQWKARVLKAGRLRIISRPQPPSLPVFRPPMKEADIFRREVMDALAFREALRQEPSRYGLVADGFRAAVFSPTQHRLLEVFEWQAEYYLKLRAHFNETHSKLVSIPGFIRWLRPVEERPVFRDALLDFGFPDVVDGEDIAELGHQFQTLGRGRPAEILDRVEARYVAHAEMPERFWLPSFAIVYADAIWQIWVGDPALREDENNVAKETFEESVKKDLVRTLLDRSMQVHAQDSLVLEAIFMWILIHASNDLRTSFVPQDEETSLLSPDAPAGRLWLELSDWADHHASRIAFARGALSALSWMMSPSVLSLKRPSPILVPFTLVATLGPRPSMAHQTRRFGLLLEGLAIVSAFLPELDLSTIRWTVQEFGQDAGEVSLAEVLDYASDHPRPVAELTIDGHVNVRLVHPFGKETFEIWVPLEATLLSRIGKGDVPYDSWMVLLGPEDGRLYRLIDTLYKEGKDAQKLDYVRYTLTAPWRIVRNDPLDILQWGRADSQRYVPRSLDDLRELLSEPGPLPEEARANWISDRLVEGAWADRVDRIQLAGHASEVPSPLAVGPLVWLLAEEGWEARIQRALARLRDSTSFPIGQIHRDIMFLRTAAEHHPSFQIDGKTVHLSSALTEALETLLDTESKMTLVGEEGSQTAKRRSLARSEAGLLRLMGTTVLKLGAAYQCPLRDTLWLTWRLYGWYWRQIENLSAVERNEALSRLEDILSQPEFQSTQEAIKDPHNPFLFDEHRLNHRLLFILGAMASMEELAGELRGTIRNSTPHSVDLASEHIMEHLRRLAETELTETEIALHEEGKRPTPLMWLTPWTVPENALSVLLQLDPQSWSRLSQPVRIRWLERLVLRVSKGEKGASWRLTIKLLQGLLQVFELSAEELNQIEKLDGALPNDEPQNWLLSALARITLLRHGRLSERHSLRKLLLEHSLRQNAGPSSELFGHYLTALTYVAPEDIEAETLEALKFIESDIPAIEAPTNTNAKAQQQRLGLFGLAVGRAAVAGSSEGSQAAVRVLKKLSEQESFTRNPMMIPLLSALGLS